MIFGHGQSIQNYEEKIIAQCTEDEYERGEYIKYIYDYTGGYGLSEDNETIHELFDQIHNSLRKDVEGIINNNRTYFKRLNTVNKIYSYGFSYSLADMPYIQKLINSISNLENCTWYFNDYNTDINKTFASKIEQCGFLGNFESFHIE